MQYNHLKSIVAARKRQIALTTRSESFYLIRRRPRYIEPTFSKKTAFPNENPSIILVQATGASGKTTTARALSYDIEIPVLDLAKHAAVGDRTLTGVLTDAYSWNDISTVLTGFREGTYGVIIDGIDEARSKTTKNSFEAFLNDILRLSMNSKSSVIVVLGRSQVLLDAWCYLGDQEANVGLVEIDRFGLQQSRSYIDSHVKNQTGIHLQTYKDARDYVLNKLEEAFQPSDHAEENSFLKFIGYPPVLDAIVTLLNDRQNHYHIRSMLEHSGYIEAELLTKISNHLLDRERDKVFDSIDTMMQDMPHREYLEEHLYSREEQCARILAKEMSRPFQCAISWPEEIDDLQRREQLEERLENWGSIHPFLKENEDSVRNSVFSAVAIMHCTFSEAPEYQQLAYEYANLHRPTYHLLYIMGGKAASERNIDARMFNPLIQSSSDWFTLDTNIDVKIVGRSWEDEDSSEDRTANLEIDVMPSRGVTKSFCFSGEVMSDDVVLGPDLINLSVTLPCTVQLSDRSGLVIKGDCYVSALSVSIDTPDLTVRAIPRAENTHEEASELFIDAQSVDGSVGRVADYGTIRIQAERHELAYPMARYFFRRTGVSGDLEELKDRFLRLKRILLDFAARRNRGLAKSRDKIENRRVLRNDVNDIGERVLQALKRDNVVTLDGHLYRMDRNACSRVLGVSWQQLRDGETSRKLRDFLAAI